MILACLSLAACAPRGVVDGSIYRTAAAPIYSNAVFDFGRLDGHWDQVASFAEVAQKNCNAGGAEFAGTPAERRVTYRLCLSGRDVSGAGAVVATGPGRFKVKGTDGLAQDWWVLWVDESYRTMAIGNPSGTFGFILNRGKVLPADRLNAARDVFDFNGYDTARLQAAGK